GIGDSLNGDGCAGYRVGVALHNRRARAGGEADGLYTKTGQVGFLGRFGESPGKLFKLRQRPGRELRPPAAQGGSDAGQVVIECLRRLSGISGQDKAQSLRFSPSIPQPLRAILDQRNEVLEAPAEDVESGRHDLRRALVALEGVSEVK